MKDNHPNPFPRPGATPLSLRSDRLPPGATLVCIHAVETHAWRRSWRPVWLPSILARGLEADRTLLPELAAEALRIAVGELAREVRARLDDMASAGADSDAANLEMLGAKPFVKAHFRYREPDAAAFVAHMTDSDDFMEHGFSRAREAFLEIDGTPDEFWGPWWEFAEEPFLEGRASSLTLEAAETYVRWEVSECGLGHALSSEDCSDWLVRAGGSLSTLWLPE